MIGAESGSAISVHGLGALLPIQSPRHQGIVMSTQEQDKEAEADVAYMKRQFSKTMQGREMFLCMIALAEMAVEVLLTANDNTPDDYNPFEVYFNMFDEALESAQLVEVNELEDLEMEDETRLH